MLRPGQVLCFPHHCTVWETTDSFADDPIVELGRGDVALTLATEFSDGEEWALVVTRGLVGWICIDPDEHYVKELLPC